MLQKTLYFEPLRDVERNFKFVQFFYTPCRSARLEKADEEKKILKNNTVNQQYHSSKLSQFLLNII